jgi:hypothetical protein
MHFLATFKHPSAFLPVVMSLGAFATVLIYLALNGPTPQTDEGTAAHIWQLLMAGQLPVIAFFFITNVRKTTREAVSVLALQCVAALAAMAPVYLLHW